MNRALVIVLLIVATAFVVDAVDKSKFKTCEKVPFCKRNRNRGHGGEKDASKYQIPADSVSTSANGIAFDLVDTEWPLRKALVGTLSLHQNGVARLRITEKEPKFTRFEVRDVLIEDALAAGSPASIKKEDGSATIEVDATRKVVLSTAPNPFLVEVYVNGKVAMRANSLGQFHFEQYRDGPNPNPGNDAKADPSASAFPYDDDDMWEQKFQSHKDSNPRGPADFGMDISFVDTEHIYGIPEHASSLALKSTTGDNAAYSDPFRLYNLDVFEYDLDVPMALYGAIPFIMSHDAQKTVAMLWLNAAETFVDVSSGTDSSGVKEQRTHWMSETGVVDVFFFLGPATNDVYFQYAALTGFTALPQRFAIAYHQCRWNYKSQDDVRNVDAGFDEHDIPYDVLWLDIEHTDGKRYFTWDKGQFSNPEEMQNNVASKGRKMVNIVDPHIKRDRNYDVHKTATDNKYYVQNPKEKGGDFEGWCWPGSSSYLDFLQPKVREYWANHFSLANYPHSTQNLYIWNDMNEPSVFNGPEITMQKDNLHGGEEEIEHRDVHNMYGFYVHKATSEGLIKRDNARPFVLTRSFFSGSQRYSAMWTGDNMAQWSHLAAAGPMLMSLAVSGYSFVGADVGGFFGDPSVELLVRWYQAAAFQPFFRAHAHIDTKRREPWLFGEPYTSHIRDAIRLRYTYLPYLYTTFHDASTRALPVIRPLWSEFGQDEATFGLDDQFLAGGSLMITPVSEEGKTTQKVYLPGSEPWYDIFSYRAHVGPGTATLKAPIHKTPILQRGGSIIPRRMRARRSSSLMNRDPFTIVVALDSKLQASGHLYDDDGRSFDYQTGAYIHRSFSFKDTVLTSTASNTEAFKLATPSNGSYKSGCIVERIIIAGLRSPPKGALVKAGNGEVRSVQMWQGSEGGSHLVEIRKPALPIDEDFTVELMY